jgi:hypothetical protein
VSGFGHGSSDHISSWSVLRSGAKKAHLAIAGVLSRRCLPCLTCLASLALIAGTTTVAYAKPVTSAQDDDAAANARFDEGRALMDRGEYARACPKFAESERLQPSGRAVFNLGDCYERLGKYASALTAFEEALRRARAAHKTDVAELTLKRVIALSPKVGRLILEPSDKALITVDGEMVVIGNLGPEGLAVDPGEHIVVASAPQKKAWTKTVFFTDDNRSQRIAIPPLEDADKTTGGTSGNDKGGSGGAHASTGFPWRTVGIVGGSAGVVAVGVGVALGLAAQSRLDHVRAVCPQGPGNTLVCSTPAVKKQATDDDLNPAVNLANASTILIVSGAVLAAAGLTLALVDPFGGHTTVTASPYAQAPSAQISVSPFGAAITGRF